MTNEELIKKIETQIDFEKKSESEYNIGRRDAYTNVLILFKQLEETKITEEQAWKIIAKSMNRPVMFWENMRDDYSNSLKDPELSVIPQFVADWIEENKSKFSILDISAIIRTEGLVNQKVDDWICKNDEMFVRAWIDDNYTIEKEPDVKVSIKSNDKTEFEIKLPESAARKLINEFRVWNKWK